LAQKRPTVIRPEKEAAVRDLSERLERAQIALVADYRGLTVAQLTELRRQLAGSETEIRVAKNTLARLAVAGTPREVLVSQLEGPTAFVLGYQDPAQTAKVFSDTVRTQRLTVPVKGALLGDRLLSTADVTRLAELPSREVLRATLVGTLNGPLAAMVGVLNGALHQLVGTLEARSEQLGGAAA
jgi:large subunit ribosomal protein L10